MKQSTFPKFSRFLSALTPKAIALGAIGAAMTVIGGSMEPPVATAITINTDDPDVFLRRGALGCQGCDLNDADLSDQERPRARLRQAQLEDADLSGSNFRASHFTCANLEDADLSDGNFE
ncbi:MAG: pentapeptide repeat-containing protein, partial [Cyanobacteria bacterium P01_H01_bin.130]